MLREYKRFLDWLHIAATGALIVAAYAVLYGSMRGRPVPLKAFDDYLPAISLFAFVVMAGLSRGRFSALNPLGTPSALARDLGASYVFGSLAYAFVAYTLKLPHLSRMYIFGGMAWSYLAAAAWHLGAYYFYRGAYARGVGAKAALLIGDDASLPQVIAILESNRALGLRVAGVLNTGSEGAEAVEKMLDSRVIDYAIFTDYRRNPALVEKAMAACRERGIEIWLKPDFIPDQIQFSRVDHLQDMPLFVFSTTPREGLAVLLKRLIDIAAALALLPVLAAAMLAVSLLTRLTGGGAALFKQRRIGLNGREFTMYKFRSMEGSRGRPLRNELKGPVFKMSDDPRVTPLGRILRKYSIDELPQLWNVLLGDMSLVGPRPPLPSEVGKYKGWQRRRLSMRPGITGLWQVAGRNSIPDFDDWVKLDLKYIDGWSLWLDLAIVARTIPAVVKGTGL